MNSKVKDLPIIECEVTFLSEQEGGRKGFMKGMLSGYQYRPLLVIGDVNQRKAIIGENNMLIEEYLGIAFFEGPEIVEPNKLIRTSMVLMGFPNFKYEKLLPKTTFTIREGPQIVAFGTVITRRDR